MIHQRRKWKTFFKKWMIVKEAKTSIDMYFDCPGWHYYWKFWDVYFDLSAVGLWIRGRCFYMYLYYFQHSDTDY